MHLRGLRPYCSVQGGKAQGLVVLSPSLPTWQWTVWVKSEGRQNGFDIFAILTPRRWI
jgi:hypothetical protein